MERNNPNNEPALVSDRIKALFEKLSPLEQRICLQELSDELDITLNFDLISQLKMKVKKLEMEQGELKSYIEELEDQKGVIIKEIEKAPKRKLTFEEMFALIPKEEKKEMKKRIVTAKYYKLIVAQLDAHKAHIKRLQDSNASLIAQIVKLRQSNGE